MPVRIVYMGTPEFACPALQALARHPDADVALVVTQPDRLAGRGRKLQAPPVKTVAEEMGLPVYQTASLRTADQREPIISIAPDLIVVAAFGLILGPSILNLPQLGCVNLHASLLPAYRGAAPISAAIAAGDLETGVTLMRMERGLDTGPMLAAKRIDINEKDTTESLTPRLANVAATLLVEALGSLIRGELADILQSNGASITRPLVKGDGWLDWMRPAIELERHVRAMWSWPRAWTTLANGDVLQIHTAHIQNGRNTSLTPGSVVDWNDHLAIQTVSGLLIVDRGQLPGGKPQPGEVLARRHDLRPGAMLGTVGRPSLPDPLVMPVED